MFGEKACKDGQGLLAGVVLKPLGIGLRCLWVEPDCQQEPDDQFVSRPGRGRHRLAGRRQEQPSVRLGIHQTVALEPRDRRSNRRLRDTHASGNIHSARLALFRKEVGDQLDVILGDCRAVSLALLRKASCLVFRGR